ncbi:hypothetical protein D9615_006216 [Tricholomella constricta]|uniref:Uracil-DNA glycosylase-like domain-containing protein n=1 Tax=Tricholomella constricta TaxID=117010 RepID=A0A8H5HBD4_9AGAR|nr:hypothetical protein D9615_006216 [Tricholomella constricta]
MTMDSEHSSLDHAKGQNDNERELSTDELSTQAEDAKVLSGFQVSLASFAYKNPVARRPPSLSSQGSKKDSLKRRLESSDADEASASGSQPSLVKQEESITGTLGPSPKKRKQARGYAGPETYAHLRVLQDVLTEGLDVIFCGINPGQKSAEIGHHFGHPNNHFWPCLYESGFTSTRLPPEEDHTLPERFALGLTNLVNRPTAEVGSHNH